MASSTTVSALSGAGSGLVVEDVNSKRPRERRQVDRGNDSLELDGVGSERGRKCSFLSNYLLSLFCIG